jgi:Zn2+/Cd2+-exporting ATPase
VADLAPLPGVDAADLLRVAASLERYSEHPIAAALVAAARERGLDLSEPTGVTAVIGRGVRGEVDGQATVVGAPALLAEIGLRASPDLLDRLDRARAAGQTAMVVAAGRPLGVIAVADSVRPAAAGVIARLRRLGVRRIVMLTGDHRAVAERLAARLGIDEVRADLLPDQKQAAIAALVREEGQVVMVGDGVNDAPALATATVGVAMGAAGTDVALETADVVLMSDDLTKLAYAIDLSRRARRIVIQNLAFALLVIIVLALATLADSVTLPLGVLGHEGSTVLVILNSLRLLLVREEAAAA